MMSLSVQSSTGQQPWQERTLISPHPKPCALPSEDSIKLLFMMTTDQDKPAHCTVTEAASAHKKEHMGLTLLMMVKMASSLLNKQMHESNK